MPRRVRKTWTRRREISNEQSAAVDEPYLAFFEKSTVEENASAALERRPFKGLIVEVATEGGDH